MARIRTVKPEFWEDEAIGLISFGARLLFLACFNFADDEGLMRWTPDYLKASVFMYDKEVTTEQVETFMGELASAGLVIPYKGGKSQQRLGWILNFLKHQRINRPQPSKLPPPGLQQQAIRQAYRHRDHDICHLCHKLIDDLPTPLNYGEDDSLVLSLDHILVQSRGGSDYPSNIKSAHLACNKGKGTRDSESFTPKSVDDARLVVNTSVNHSVNEDMNDSSLELEEIEGEKSAHLACNKRKGTRDSESFTPPNTSVNHSVNKGMNDSSPEWKGREVEGKGMKGEVKAPPENFHPLQHAARLAEMIGLPQTTTNMRTVSEAIRSEAQFTGRTMEAVCETLAAKIRDDRDEGIPIDKFYFEDAKWRNGNGKQSSAAQARPGIIKQNILDGITADARRRAQSDSAQREGGTGRRVSTRN